MPENSLLTPPASTNTPPLPRKRAQYRPSLRRAPRGFCAALLVALGLLAFGTLPGRAQVAPPAPSLLKPLQDSAAWSLFTYAPASAFREDEAGGVKVTIASAGSANWHVALNQIVPVMEEGRWYVLTGRARTDRPLPLTVYFTTKSATARNIGLAQAIKANTEWTPFRYLFQVRGAVGERCVLQLMAGEKAGVVWWSDLALRPESPGEAADRAAQTDATALNGRWPLDQYQKYEGVPSVRCRYLIAPLRFANTRDRFVEPKEYFNRLFSSEWPGMGHYWRSVSYGKVRVEGEAVDWIDLPGNWQDYCFPGAGEKRFDQQRLADEVAKRHSMDGFDALALFPNIRDEGRNATGSLLYGLLYGLLYSRSARPDYDPLGATGYVMQGKRYPGVYIPDYGITAQVCAHEMGHAFGFDHPFGNWSKTNNDRWDVMGAGASWGNQHRRFGAIPGETNAYHKIMAGWIAPSQIMRLEPGMEKEFHLERLAEPTQAGYLAALIAPANTGGVFWTLEARMKAGYEMGGGIPVEGVVLHECNPARSDPTVTLMRLPGVSAPVDTDGNGSVNDAGVAWEVGKTYTNAQYHFSVTVVAREATGWTVRVRVDR